MNADRLPAHTHTHEHTATLPSGVGWSVVPVARRSQHIKAERSSRWPEPVKAPSLEERSGASSAASVPRHRRTAGAAAPGAPAALSAAAGSPPSMTGSGASAMDDPTVCPIVTRTGQMCRRRRYALGPGGDGDLGPHPEPARPRASLLPNRAPSHDRGLNGRARVVGDAWPPAPGQRTRKADVRSAHSPVPGRQTAQWPSSRGQQRQRCGRQRRRGPPELHGDAGASAPRSFRSTVRDPAARRSVPGRAGDPGLGHRHRRHPVRVEPPAPGSCVRRHRRGRRRGQRRDPGASPASPLDRT